MKAAGTIGRLALTTRSSTSANERFSLGSKTPGVPTAWLSVSLLVLVRIVEVGDIWIMFCPLWSMNDSVKSLMLRVEEVDGGGEIEETPSDTANEFWFTFFLFSPLMWDSIGTGEQTSSAGDSIESLLLPGCSGESSTTSLTLVALEAIEGVPDRPVDWDGLSFRCFIVTEVVMILVVMGPAEWRFWGRAFVDELWVEDWAVLPAIEVRFVLVVVVTCWNVINGVILSRSFSNSLSPSSVLQLHPSY